jgi:hypothetical protein
VALDEQALANEFVRLRHGWGLASTGLRARVGAQITELCGIAPGDNDRTIRSKILATLKGLMEGFPYEDRLAAETSLGASLGDQQRLLSDRMLLVAQRLNCSDRTARRRVDRAFTRLIEEALAKSAVDAAELDPGKGWYVRHLDALVRLDTPTPEFWETRTIVAQRPNLKQIAIRFSLPPRRIGDTSPRDLYADIARGARIRSAERQGEAHFRFVLDLPRPLALHEEHIYTIILRIPAGQQMRPHYALVPFIDFDSLHVCIRFDPSHRPVGVWSFDRMAPRMLDDHDFAGQPMTLDDANEVERAFAALDVGFAYGIAWRMPADAIPDIEAGQAST